MAAAELCEVVESVTTFDSVAKELDHAKEQHRCFFSLGKPTEHVEYFDLDRYGRLQRTLIQADRQLDMSFELSKDGTKIPMCIKKHAKYRPFNWIRDEEKHHHWQISMIIRNDYRRLFGLSESIRIGHFLERNMGVIIHKYGYWLEYPIENHVLSGHIDYVRTAVVSDDGRYLYTSGNDRMIIIWDLLNNVEMHRFQAHQDYVYCLDYCKGRLISCSKDCTIVIWNGITLELLVEIDEYKRRKIQVVSVRFNRNGDRFLSTSYGASIREWSSNNGECLRVYIGHKQWVYSAWFIEDSSMIISCSEDQSLRVWDSNNGRELKKMTKGLSDQMTGLCVNCDCTLLCCNGDGSSIKFFQMPDLTLYREMEMYSVRGCFHPWIPYYYATEKRNYTSRIEIYDVRTGERIGESPQRSREGIINLCFTNDGRRLIFVGNDKLVQIWDISFLL